jgi:hypothetical protein
MARTFFSGRAFKPLRLAVAVALLLTIVPWTAFADNVQNDVVAGGNGTIAAGGSTTVNYRIGANNGDGENGCNATAASPATVTISAPAAVTANPGSLVFTECDTDKPVVFSSSSPGNYEITVSVSDSGSGSYNTNPAKFILRVTAPVDTTPPVVTPNVLGTLGSNGWYVSDVTLSWTVTDGQSPITSQTGCSTTSITADTTGTVYTCSATSSGGTTSRSITIKRDATRPTLSGTLTNVPQEATGPGGATVSFSSPTFSDITSQVASVTCAPASGSNFGLGTTAVNCSATDNAGNVSDPASFNVTVQDTTPPQIAPAADIVDVQASGSGGAVVSYTPPTATDLVSGNVAVNCSPASGSTFPLGTNTVNCSATDAAGNTATSTFNVTVLDTAGPILALPGSITEEATGPSGASVTYSASAEDVVDGSVPVNCSPASGSTFPLGSTNVNCSATDAANNTSSGSFSVTVEDNTPPALTLPADIEAEATSASGASVGYTASATDLVSGNVAITCTPASGSTFPLGTTTVNCSATDAAGNTANGSFAVKVQDTTPPALTVPADITTEATGASGATVNFAASATDAVDASPTVSCSPASGSTFAIAATTVTCTATDDAGNQSSRTFTVTVRDTTPPVIEPHANITGVEATGPGGASVIFFSPNATDIVDGQISTTCSPASGATFALGTSTVTCTVTDAHGNSASSTFTVQVVDTTAPTLTDLGPTSPADGNNGWYKNAVVNRFEASDRVGFTGHTNPYVFTQSSGAAEGSAITIASGPVSDAAGNTNPGINSAAFKIDLTVPTLTGAATTSPNANGWYKNDVTIAWTGQDAVSGIDPATQPANSTITGEGSNLSASASINDLAGNIGSGSIGGIKIDRTAPTLNGVPTTSPNANGWYKNDVTIHWTASDALSGLAGPTPADSTITGEGNSLSSTASISDLAGNSKATTVSGIKIDRTAPSVALVGGPANGASYYFGSVPAAPTCSASDGLSGLDGTCSVSGYGSAVGTHTVTASVTDRAGNSSSASATYTVRAWTITGFYQPVDMGIMNNAKGGSTVPLKFEVFAGATELTSTGIVQTFTQQIGCSGGGGDDIEQYATGGTSLRYDITSGQFIFNWQTPRSPGACYRVIMTTQDGSTISADFKLK